MKAVNWQGIHDWIDHCSVDEARRAVICPTLRTLPFFLLGRTDVYDLSIWRASITLSCFEKFSKPVSRGLALNSLAAMNQNKPREFSGRNTRTYELRQHVHEAYYYALRLLTGRKSHFSSARDTQLFIFKNKSLSPDSLLMRYFNLDNQAALLTYNMATELLEAGAAHISRSEIENGLEFPLWWHKTPNLISSIWSEVREQFNEVEGLRFWVDWYQGLLDGRKPDWELWKRIALIDDKHWQSGAEAVAREIDRIKAELEQERRKRWEPQAKSIIQRADIFAAQAELLAQTIDNTLSEILKELGCLNKAPDALQPLEDLSRQLRQLKLTLTTTRNPERQVELVAEILGAMYGTICTLNDKLGASKSWAEKNPVKTGILAGAVTELIGFLAITACTSFLGSNADDQVPVTHQYTYNQQIHICPDEDLGTLPPPLSAPDGLAEASHVPANDVKT